MPARRGARNGCLHKCYGARRERTRAAPRCRLCSRHERRDHAATETSDALSPERAAEMIEGGDAQLVDVRQDFEWEAGRIAGAVHIPLEHAAGPRRRDRPRAARHLPVPQRRPLGDGNRRVPRLRLRGLQPRGRPRGLGRARPARSSPTTARSPCPAPTTAERWKAHPTRSSQPAEPQTGLPSSPSRSRGPARLARPGRPQGRNPHLRRRGGPRPRPRCGDRRDRDRRSTPATTPRRTAELDQVEKQLGGVAEQADEAGDLQDSIDSAQRPARLARGQGHQAERPPAVTRRPARRRRGRHRGPAAADLRPRLRLFLRERLRQRRRRLGRQRPLTARSGTGGRPRRVNPSQTAWPCGGVRTLH